MCCKSNKFLHVRSIALLSQDKRILSFFSGKRIFFFSYRAWRRKLSVPAVYILPPFKQPTLEIQWGTTQSLPSLSPSWRQLSMRASLAKAARADRSFPGSDSSGLRAAHFLSPASFHASLPNKRSDSL